MQSAFTILTLFARFFPPISLDQDVEQSWMCMGILTFGVFWSYLFLQMHLLQARDAREDNETNINRSLKMISWRGLHVTVYAPQVYYFSKGFKEHLESFGS